MLKQSLTKLLASSFAIVILLLSSVVALAQTDSGKISGYAKDANGAIVPGASISVVNEKTGEERSAKANDDGYFVVPALKASTYRVIGEISGMTGKIDHVELSVGQTLTLNLAMAASGVSATVNVVSGEETIANTASAAIGTDGNARHVEGLPVTG